MTSTQQRAGTMPRRSAHESRHRLLLVASLFAMLLVVGYILGTSRSAAAEDELLSSYPRASATVSGLPAEITLTFSTELQAPESGAVIDVIGEEGTSLTEGPPAIVGEAITQDLSDRPIDGEITVQWQVISTSGTAMSGEYAFTVGATETPTVSPTPASSPSPSSEEGTAEPSSAAANSGYGDVHNQGSADLDALPVLVITAGVAFLGGATFLMIMTARARRRRDQAAQQEEPDES